MKKIFNLPLLLLVLFFSGCNTLKVTTDYDKAVDFSKYKKFAFYKMNVTDNVSQLNQQRIITSIKNEMVKKGFVQDETTPDILINTTAIIQDKQSISANTYGYGGYYRPYGWGVGSSAYTTVNTYDYKDGSLIIDIIDASNKQLIWQGTGNKELDSPSPSTERKIAEGIAKILYSFPPQKTGGK